MALTFETGTDKAVVSGAVVAIVAVAPAAVVVVAVGGGVAVVGEVGASCVGFFEGRPRFRFPTSTSSHARLRF